MLAVSAQTSTGFAPVAVTELGPGSQLWLMGSMFVGGSAGSSAGGIKIIRFLILLRLLQMVLRRTALARHAVADIEVAGSRPGEGELRTVLVVGLLYIVTIFASWLPLVASGLPPLAALFEVVSAIGTVGLSAGITGPDLAAWIKVLLCIDMLMGRLEIVAVLVLLAPHTWFGKRIDRP
jgi:trk system potassium uptake protein TrkH